VAGEEKDFEVLERDDRYIWPTYDKFYMELFSPVSWEAIAGTRIDFEEWEHVTILKNISLASEETESGLKGYIAVGTNYCYGEDVTNRGRIWILDIIDVVPEPGMPLTRNKIKMIYCKEQKGPVTALTEVKGFLLSAIGQKIYIWQLKESQLVGIAFIDTQIFINSAVSIKNLVLVSDVYKSISLLRYQEETRTLALVSRDTRSSEVYGCQFIVDQNQLCFLVSDSDGNLVVHSYNPEMRESFGGTRLIRRADFHLGSRTVSFFRIRCLPLSEARGPELKQMTVYATLDGSIGYVLPVAEKVYRRLLMLQNVLNTHIQHLAGLNPKAYRMCRLSRKTLQPTTSKAILDGDLLIKFNSLSFSEKNEVAKKIGSTAIQVNNSLSLCPFITDLIRALFVAPDHRRPDGNRCHDRSFLNHQIIPASISHVRPPPH
jgi:cleavage and polyadenylation specificity factor subunit 1